MKVKATAEDMILLCEQHESPELPVRPIIFRPVSSCHVFCPFLCCRFLSCSVLSFFLYPSSVIRPHFFAVEYL